MVVPKLTASSSISPPDWAWITMPALYSKCVLRNTVMGDTPVVEPLITMPPQLAVVPGARLKRIGAVAVPSATMRPPLLTVRSTPEAR